MLYVGIDVASDKHDFNIISSSGKQFKKRSITVSNDQQGYKKLHESIKEFCGACNDNQVRIGLESTGFYHLNLVFYLLKLNYSVTIINPLLTNMYKKSKKVHTPKTDNLDSLAICNYLKDNESDFKPYTLKSYHTESLKSLSRERFKVVEELRQAKITYHRILAQLFPEFLTLFSNIYQGTALNIIEKYPSPSKLSKAHVNTIKGLIHGKCKTTAESVILAAKNSIGNDSPYLSFSLEQAIKTLKFLDEKNKSYIQMINKYIELLDTKITSIKGVGFITAGIILGEIGDITRFKNAEHLISYAGLDIEVYESGKFKATSHRISKKGSKYLRYALWQVAKVCWKFDSMFKAYYHKKKSEGKHFYVILGHIEKKLVRVIYSVLKNNKEYTPQN